MRRSLMFAIVLAACVAVLGACDPKTDAPNKPPVATPSPVATASPAASPSASPSVSPAKPAVSPEVKKKDGTNKEAKPAATASPKVK